MNYSFCESVHATGRSPWHIRRLAGERKLGGGIDTPSLCGLVERGWDLPVEIAANSVSHVCKQCLEVYLKEIGRPNDH